MAADFRLGAWLVQPGLNSVSCNGTSQRLEPKVMEVLVCLASRAGETVSKDELLKTVWPDTFVTDDGLIRSISELRRIFDDDAREPRVIQTIHKRGYRLVASVNAAHSSAVITDTKQSAAKQIPPGTGGGGRKVQKLLLAAVAVLLLVLAATSGRIARWLWPAGNAASIHSLAVLPLQNLSGDPTQEYFSDGMTDALITELAQIDSVKVISRTSTIQYKGTRKTLPEIARELKVDGVIEGTIQRSGDRVRITAQLIHGATDKHVWAESYEGNLSDVLALENQVARAIADAIKIRLTPVQSARLAHATQIDREAYDLYLKGRYFWNKRDPADLKKALEYFQQAAEKAPNYAPAQTGLADTYSLLGSAGYDLLPRAEAMEKARVAATRALTIDDKLAEAHASLAFVAYSYDWDWTLGETEFKRAIGLNPNYPTARQWYSEMLNDLGRKEEALAQAEAALTLDPLSLNANENVARTHYFARRFDQAIETSRKTLEMDPYFAIAHLRLGRAYAAEGRYVQSSKEFQDFSRLSRDTPLATASIGNALARSGDRSGAIRALHELTTLSKHAPVPSICFALVHAGLGDDDQAIDWLEKAYKERSDFLLVLNVDPLFDDLRPKPRFQELLHRIGFPGGHELHP
jgi:TolB-like protein/DNA-binding winged helix-turn-helix (wHTH) protein/Tfp pilus assembly protein PilF